MHEYSLACSIAEICRDSAEANGLAVVTRIVLRVGPLAGVQQETLHFLFAEVADAHGIGRPDLYFELEPLSIHCAACGHAGAIPLPEGGFVEIWHNPTGQPLPRECPACGATGLTYPDAMAFEIKEIEGEREEDAAGGRNIL